MNGVYELKYYSDSDAVPSYATSMDGVQEYWQLVDYNVVMVLIIIPKSCCFKWIKYGNIAIL